MPNLPGKHFFNNLIERRSLLYQLSRRDFERRFVGSAGGWLWTLIHPLVQLLVWTFIFHICMRQPVPPGAGTENYSLFLFCGYLPWMLFQDTVSRSSTSLLDSANLITKTVFPSEMIPISVFFSSLVSHVVTVFLAILCLFIWGDGVTAQVLLIPLGVIFLSFFSIGVSWIAASFQVYLRDTAQAVTVALSLWFWVTPIFINVNQVPEGFRAFIYANPLSVFVEAYRSCLLSSPLPAASSLIYAAAISVTTFIVGGLLFRQLKRGFADVL